MTAMSRAFLVAAFCAACLALRPAVAAAAPKVPVAYTSDLFYPPEDPDDYFDMAVLHGLDFDVKAVVLDGYAPGGKSQTSSPGSKALSILREVTGRTHGVSIGGHSPGATGSAGSAALLEAVKWNRGLTIIVVGALTDLAAAYKADPSAFVTVDKVMLFAGDAAGLAEHNTRLDPAAWETIVNSDLPVVWLPSFDGGFENRGARSARGRATWVSFRHDEIFQGVPGSLAKFFALAGVSYGDTRERNLYAAGLLEIAACDRRSLAVSTCGSAKSLGVRFVKVNIRAVGARVEYGTGRDVLAFRVSDYAEYRRAFLERSNAGLARAAAGLGAQRR